MKAGTHILSLDTTGATLDLIGGKGQSLASMTSAGFDVPSGFYLTTTAYRSFIKTNDLQTKIIELAKPEIGKYTLSFDLAADSIQALIGKPEIPEEINENDPDPQQIPEDVYAACKYGLAKLFVMGDKELFVVLTEIPEPAIFGLALFGTQKFGASEQPLVRQSLTGSGHSNFFKIF